MSKKIGRNDPCPCGSGKKYKNCCLNDEKIIPFPGSFDINPSQNLQNNPPIQSQEHDNIRTLPFGSKNTFETEMPFGFPNDIPPTPENLEMMQNLAAMIEDAGISNEEELEEFLDEILPMDKTFADDFLGLSSNQVDSIIKKSIGENKHIVEFKYKANEKGLSDTLIIKRAFAFLELLKEFQPLKGTAKGNLSRKFVQTLFDTPHYFYDEKWARPNKEEDDYNINLMRILLNMAELIKFENSKFSLTLKGEDILATKNASELYKQLFLTYAEKFNWGYFDDIPDDIYAIMQDTFLFNLLLLEEYADDFLDISEYARHYLQAFPLLERHIGYAQPGPVKMTAHAMSVRCMDRFLIPFGLVEYRHDRIQPEGARLPRFKYYYKKTELFENLIHWKI